MKGIVLAGGTGSRLMPLTKSVNKHLLPVGTKPMIYYPIGKLIEFGIDDIIIVTGIEHANTMIQNLGSGKDFNCEFTYKVQDEAGGIAQALGICESIIGNNDVVVILGDNIFTGNIPFDKESHAEIALYKSDTPERFGVVEYDEHKNIVKIHEKPENPITNDIVTGIYKYPNHVFDIIKTLKPSERGELEITDVNNEFIRLNKLKYFMLEGPWTDAGTFESLIHANNIVTEIF